MHIQNFLPSYPPIPGNVPSFYLLESTPFVIPPPGAVHINQDPLAPLSVNVPPYSNPQGAIVYDFGGFTNNFWMLHYGKIYYFYYKIFDSMGNVAADGYIKHKFYNDTDNINDIPPSDSWQYLTDVPDLAPMYDVAVMYHTGQFEMCLTNRNKVSPPLPSSVDVIDLATGTVHILEFTSDINGIYVYFD